MSQYKTGTVSISNGSTYVSGAGTLWYSVGIQEGDLFNLQGADGWYYVAAIQSNTSLTLTAPYTDGAVSSQPYAIHRDFLSPYDFPLMRPGNVNWTSVYNEALRKITTQLGGGIGGVGTGLDGAYDIESTIIADNDRVAIRRRGQHDNSGACAFAVIDENTMGQAASNIWFDNAINYMYSKHNPTLSVINNESSGLGTQSATPQTALIAGAIAGDHNSSTLETFRSCKNTGIVAISIDQYNAYIPNASTNVGLKAYSSNGFAICAHATNYAALYINQTASTSLDAAGIVVNTNLGIPLSLVTTNATTGCIISNTKANAGGLGIQAARPLEVNNMAFLTNSASIVVSSYTRGLQIESYAVCTEGNPLVSLDAGTNGISISSNGCSIINNYGHGTGLKISAGLQVGGVSTPALWIESQGSGIYIQSGTGTSAYAIIAGSNTTPAIYSQNGIVTTSTSYGDISIPILGTLTYSLSNSSLMLYGSSGWRVVATSESTSEFDTGVVIYYSDVSHLTRDDPGLVVYDGADEKLMYFDNAGASHDVVSVDSFNDYQTRCVCFCIPNSLEVENNVASVTVPFSGRLIAAVAQVDTRPLGDNIDIDIKLDGAVVKTLRIANGSYTTVGDIGTTTYQTIDCNLQMGQKIVLDVTSIGSTQAGGNDTRVTIVVKQSTVMEIPA